MTERYITGEDGNTIFEVARIKSHGKELVVLTPVDTWDNLAKAVREMEKEASRPCHLCSQGYCETCSYH